MMALHHIQWCSHFPMMAYKCFLWWYTDTISTTMRKPVQLWFPCFVLKKMHDEGCHDRVVWWWNRCFLAMEQTLSNSNTIASIFKTVYIHSLFKKPFPSLHPSFTSSSSTHFHPISPHFFPSIALLCLPLPSPCEFMHLIASFFSSVLLFVWRIKSH